MIKNYNGFVITSPTRPNVSQVSTESVVIKWDMDAPFSTDPVIPIKFFKLQFREFFRGKGRSTWHTMEEVIDPEVRAFEILGLHTDRKYRFRVVVVFDNNDQRFGPLSKKFRLNTKDLSLSPKYAPKPKPNLWTLLKQNQNQFQNSKPKQIQSKTKRFAHLCGHGPMHPYLNALIGMQCGLHHKL